MTGATVDLYLYKWVDSNGKRLHECREVPTTNPLPIGQGMNPFSFAKEIKDCEDINCVDCADNYMNCIQCKFGESFYSITTDPVTNFNFCKEKKLDVSNNPVSMILPNSTFVVVATSFLNTKETIRMEFSKPINSLINFESIKITCYQRDLVKIVSSEFIKGEIKDGGQTLLLHITIKDDVENGLI